MSLQDEVEKIILDCERMYEDGRKEFFMPEAIGRIKKLFDGENKLLKPGLKWFAELMEEDLKKNDFKGGWLDKEYNYYWGKTLKHILELRPVDAVKVGRKKYSIGQCVKASNYLMMFAHNLMEELREGKVK